MDRVAFLRSLPYLRQLDPEIWAATTSNNSGNDESQEVYSGSTVTPPTPSKNKSLFLFEESAVVSIEPRIWSRERKSIQSANNEDGDEIMDMDAQHVLCRKRGRSDLEIDASTTDVHHNHTAPAFFQKCKLNTEERDTENTDETDHAESKEIDFQSINNDPALCSFEAAIVRHNPNPLGSPVKQDGGENCDDGISNWLLFRFGSRFVFLVDKNAIINITYYSSTDEKDGTEQSKDAIQSPPAKRQKNANHSKGETEPANPTNVEKVTRPASLVVSFPFCSFRMFSLQNKNDEAAREGTNSTRSSFLLKTVMTAEEKLMKARSMLLKHFELDEEKVKLQNRSSSREMITSGRSFAIQHDFEDEAALANSSIPSFLVSNSSSFLDEDWSFCVDDSKTLPCASLSSSIQKDVSPSKIEGSGSAKGSSSSFENGQKIDMPVKGSPETLKDDEGERDSNKDDTTGGDDLEEGDKKSGSEKEEVQNNDVDDEAIALTEEKKKQSTDIEIKNEVQHSWKNELLNKRCDFDSSWSSVQKAMHNKTTTQTKAKEDGRVSHFTRAAQSLSSSYLSPGELIDMSSQAEDDIVAATKGIEKELEKIFPGRGSRKPTANPTDLGNFKEKIEDLLRLRQESVDAKLALLFTPKR